MTDEARYLKAIAGELHELNKVLGRMAQAPAFYTEDQIFELTKKSIAVINDDIIDKRFDPDKRLAK